MNDSEYKDQLIKMMKQYILEFGSRVLPRSTTPFIITSGEKEYFYSPAVNHVVSGCSHKDADTYFVLHGSKVDSDVAVVFEDADVLILMIRAY